MSHKKRTANEQKDPKSRRRAGRNLGRFAFVIPAYNHAATVAQVAGRARDMGFPVFVVDDGSTDDTSRRLAEVQGIEVLRHEKNEGKGAAILTGFMAASHKADYAITIDADGQHDPEDAIHLMDAIPLKKRPIVVGARRGMDAVQGPTFPGPAASAESFPISGSGCPEGRKFRIPRAACGFIRFRNP